MEELVVAATVAEAKEEEVSTMEGRREERKALIPNCFVYFLE
jgi:hypothetical protein